MGQENSMLKVLFVVILRFFVSYAPIILGIALGRVSSNYLSFWVEVLVHILGIVILLGALWWLESDTHRKIGLLIDSL